MAFQVFCPIHKKQSVFTLRYHSTRYYKKRKGKSWKRMKTKTNPVEFVYCPKCDLPFKLTVKMKAVRRNIKDWYAFMGERRKQKLKEITAETLAHKKRLEKRLFPERRKGRPYSPKPLPIKITRLANGWYFSQYQTRFHYVKNNRFYCHPNHPINLSMIPVDHPKKLMGKMCKMCGQKKGVYEYEEKSTWEKHHIKKTQEKRKKYEHQRHKKRYKPRKILMQPVGEQHDRQT